MLHELQNDSLCLRSEAHYPVSLPDALEDKSSWHGREHREASLEPPWPWEHCTAQSLWEVQRREVGDVHEARVSGLRTESESESIKAIRFLFSPHLGRTANPRMWSDCEPVTVPKPDFTERLGYGTR